MAHQITSAGNDAAEDILTLAFLVDHFDADGFVFADAGQGAAFGERGRFVHWTPETEAQYGSLMMVEIEDEMSDDGVEVGHESDWIDGENGYRFKVRF